MTVAFKEVFLGIVSWLSQHCPWACCTGSLGARSAAERCIGSVFCTWNICGRPASCVTTAGHATAPSAATANLLPNVSLHVM